VTRNLRIALTVLSIGFAVEGAGEVYTRVVPGSAAPGASLFYLIPLVLTAVGLLFVWVGREEWNDVHRGRVRSANRAFGLSLLGAVVAAAVLGLLVALPALGTPEWAALLFGAAVASLVFGTFVTYAYLVFHLISNPARVAVALSLIWAFAISVLVAVSLAGALPTILALVRNRTISIPSFVTPVDFLISYLFVSYFLLLAAYVEAHRAVARGLVRAAGVDRGPVPAPAATKGR
jgi:hypothetical protein